MARDEISGTERVLTLALSVTAERHREEIMQRFVEAAAEVTDSQRAIVATIDAEGAIESLFSTGIADDEAQRVRQTPVQDSIFGHIPEDRCLIVNSTASYAPSGPWLESLPSSESFLAAPVRFGDAILARLYLADKASGYSRIDARNCSLLAQALGVALSNSQANSALSDAPGAPEPAEGVQEADQAQAHAPASEDEPIPSRRAARAKARHAAHLKHAGAASPDASAQEAPSATEKAQTEKITELSATLAAETEARKRSQKEVRALKAALKAKENELARTLKSIDTIKRRISEAHGGEGAPSASVAAQLRRFAEDELRTSAASLAAVQKELSRLPGMSQPALNRLDVTLRSLQNCPGKLRSLADQLSSSHASEK